MNDLERTTLKLAKAQMTAKAQMDELFRHNEHVTHIKCGSSICYSKQLKEEYNWYSVAAHYKSEAYVYESLVSFDDAILNLIESLPEGV